MQPPWQRNSQLTAEYAAVEYASSNNISVLCNSFSFLFSLFFRFSRFFRLCCSHFYLLLMIITRCKLCLYCWSVCKRQAKCRKWWQLAGGRRQVSCCNHNWRQHKLCWLWGAKWPAKAAELDNWETGHNPSKSQNPKRQEAVWHLHAVSFRQKWRQVSRTSWGKLSIHYAWKFNEFSHSQKSRWRETRERDDPPSSAAASRGSLSSLGHFCCCAYNFVWYQMVAIFN